MDLLTFGLGEFDIPILAYTSRMSGEIYVIRWAWRVRT